MYGTIHARIIAVVLFSILSVSVTVADNSDTVFELVVNADHIEDAWLNNALESQNLNYGAHGGAIAGYNPGSVYLLRMLDLPELLGDYKNILSCTLYVYISSADGNAGDKTVGVKRVFKPWIAGTLDGGDPGPGEGCTYNEWSSDSAAWGLPGCHLENDGGDDNTGNGTGADCKVTPEDVVVIPQTAQSPWLEPGYRAWVISPELVMGWYEGSIHNNGLVMKTIGPWGWVHPWQADYADETKQPYFIIEYESMLYVNIVPAVLPTVVPASGGQLDFRYELDNNAPAGQWFDLWTQIVLPQMGMVETAVRHDMYLNAQSGRDGWAAQNIPGNAPPGIYTFNIYLGEYPWIVECADSFTFEKPASDGPGIAGSDESWWFEMQDDKDRSVVTMTDQNVKFDHHASPNPFNPTTVLSFNLPAAGNANLTVYDVSGRLVANLVDGWRDAGIHEATFDASHLASGIYIYRLQSGSHIATGKLVLTK